MLRSKDPEKEPWKDVPIEIIIEEERKKREIEDSWNKRPTIYDQDIPPGYPPKEKKKEKGGSVTIKMYQ